MATTTLEIRGETDDGEDIVLPFEFPSEQNVCWRADVLRFAQAALWNAMYTPGSVRYKVYSKGVDLFIGED